MLTILSQPTLDDRTLMYVSHLDSEQQVDSSTRCVLFLFCCANWFAIRHHIYLAGLLFQTKN
jgi:hypothetical protein